LVSTTDTPKPPEVAAIQAHVKGVLRQRGWTYADLAREVEVSEVSIKRWLTARDLSLARVNRIARALGSTGFALLVAAAQGQEEAFTLDEATEGYLADHPVDHAVWQSLQRGLSEADVQDHYGIDPRAWGRTLRRLEAHDLLEVLPGDRVRRTRRGVHSWIRGGPLARQTLGWRHRRLVRWLAEGEGATVQSADRRMSGPSAEVAADELVELARRWRDRAWRDEQTTPLADQRGVSWVLVLAPTDVFAPIMGSGPSEPGDANDRGDRGDPEPIRWPT